MSSQCVMLLFFIVLYIERFFICGRKEIAKTLPVAYLCLNVIYEEHKVSLRNKKRKSSKNHLEMTPILTQHIHIWYTLNLWANKIKKKTPKRQITGSCDVGIYWTPCDTNTGTKAIRISIQSPLRPIPSSLFVLPIRSFFIALTYTHI